MKKIILIQTKKAKNNIEKEENKNNINIKLYKLNKKKLNNINEEEVEIFNIEKKLNFFLFNKEFLIFYILYFLFISLILLLKE